MKRLYAFIFVIALFSMLLCGCGGQTAKHLVREDWSDDVKNAVKNAINTFAVKTGADDSKNPLGFKYGFLTEYAGYHIK